MNKFNLICDKFGEFEKQFFDLSDKVEKLEKENNEYKNKIKQSNDVIKQLKSRVDNNEKYLSALTFISCFTWREITNDILQEEAKNKFVDELDKETLDNWVNINSLDENSENKITISVQDYYAKSFVPYYTPVSTPAPEIDSINIGDLNIKLNKKDEEKPQRLRVKNVVDNPFNYSKEEVYAVSKYLRKIIEKDTDLSKYID